MEGRGLRVARRVPRSEGRHLDRGRQGRARDVQGAADAAGHPHRAGRKRGLAAAGRADHRCREGEPGGGAHAARVGHQAQLQGAEGRRPASEAPGDPDPEATQRRIHQQRRLVECIDAEGGWNLHARGTVADGAKIHAALAPILEERFRANRAAGTHEAAEVNAFDALVELATRKGDGGTAGRYLGLVRCDLAALQRGAVNGDELCEIAGLGPIPVGTAVDLLGDATWKLIITRGVDVANVTTLSRKATAAMLAALAWRSPVCSVEGCGRTILQIDHRVPWAETHHTTLLELDPLCAHHHDAKTHDGWELVDGCGVRSMVPPDHPGHPRHHRVRPMEPPGAPP